MSNELVKNTKTFTKIIIRKFVERKSCSCFKDNIQGEGLVDMQLIIKCNKGFQFFLCHWYFIENHTN